MRVAFSESGWRQYVEWQSLDKKMVDKINELVKDIQRNGLSTGIGKPEHLKGRKAWSRRITHEHRLVYSIDENEVLFIHSCAGHYTD